ncbi:hypothetical protein D3C80_600630 [compost metagenome]
MGVTAARQPDIACSPYPPLGAVTDRIDRVSFSGARLNLDKQDKSVFAGDDIDFAEPCPVSELQDPIPFKEKIESCEIFGDVAAPFGAPAFMPPVLGSAPHQPSSFPFMAASFMVTSR